MSKSKSKAEEAAQFLDDLDNLTPASGPNTAGAGGTANANDPADVLKFIDEITQKSSEPIRPAAASSLERPASRASLTAGSARKATERVRVGSPAPSSGGSIPGAPKGEPSSRAPTPARSEVPTESAEAASAAAASSGGWGWGSVWTSASAALQQARAAVDEGVKHLPKGEQAVKWREEVMNRVPLNKEQLEKLGHDLRTVGYSTLTDILNVVAPPISEHEVIQVWSSHDMEGFEGVESLIYKALARVMEQVEGGDLVVNKGHESKPREAASQRNLNAVDGLETAYRLAEANIKELIKSDPKQTETKQSSTQIPTTYSSVYLRVQPFYASLPTSGTNVSSSSKPPAEATHLQFLLYLSDPEHQLIHSTVTQVVPAKWLDHWETQEWVEDVVAEALRTGFETIGQEYIVSRMGWINEGTSESITPEKQEEAK